MGAGGVCGSNASPSWAEVSCSGYYVYLLYLPLPTGSIPEVMGNLTGLSYLYFQRSSLTGTIPHSLGKLSRLKRLYLNDNSMTGTLPETLGSLSALSYTCP